MSLPTAERMQAALEATWPPYRRWSAGGFTFRDGGGGGKRVSATTVSGAPGAAAIAAAAEDMTGRGNRPLFCIRPGQEAVDALLEAEGFRIVDPTVFYAAPTGCLSDAALPRLAAIASDAPLAIQREIWAAGGIGPERLAVMERAAGEKCYLLGRADERPAGAAFVALDAELAMIHAIEVAPRRRRRGVAKALLARAAAWSAVRGAGHLCLAVTRANAPARALYASLGMEVVGEYHYRIAPGKEGT